LGKQKNDSQPNHSQAPENRCLFSPARGLKKGTSSGYSGYADANEAVAFDIDMAISMAPSLFQSAAAFADHNAANPTTESAVR
jgi:hypothetical protein